MLLAAAKDLDIDLVGSYMIGDRWRDVEAGKRAGCKTFFVDYGYSEKQPRDYDFRVVSLDEAASVILKR
jgi:D-glycero-D-manno-heptose 1,7-bisphosphate phosphatase